MGGLQIMKEYIMALDQGTTSSRCILFDHAGKIVTMAQKEFTQIYPQPGWVEQNPREIWSSQMSVAIEAMANIGASSKISVPLASQTSAKPQSSGIKRPGNPYTMRSSGSAGARQNRLMN